ncbi:MAG: PRC-barrel domain-containing protein [Capsulimonas sp.]|uniref:PRC-barrel domain-containing protein n=1 Tax=Capsulimonas sp. TaxID=2494211 RepID=UPI003264A4C0
MTTRSGHNLRGTAIVAMDNGERLGRVDDLFFSPTNGELEALLVDVGGMFSKPSLLLAAQISSIGPDAVVIADREALIQNGRMSEESHAVRGGEIEDRPVLTATGTVVGKVADVMIDPETRQVIGFSLSTGLIDNTLHGRPSLPFSLVQSLGKDSLVVTSDYDPKAPEHHIPLVK